MKIHFELEGNKWSIEGIKIRDYYAIRTLLLLDNAESKYNIISHLSGCPVNTLKDFTISAWYKIWEGLENMIQVEMWDKQEVVHQFNHEGIDYGLLDFDKMTIGEFADLDVIVSDPNADSRIHEILAVLYRPIVSRKWKKNIVERYDYDGFKHRSELFLDLPLGKSKAVSGFFLGIVQASLKTTPIYLASERKMQMKMEKEAQDLLRKGGTSLSSDWLETILSRFQELQNSELEKPLISSPIKKTHYAQLKMNLKKWFKNIIQ